MKIELLNKILIILILMVLFSCDHGINPEKVEETKHKNSGISGTIYYQNWPPADSLSPEDSLYRLKLVVFRDYPPGDIVSEVSSGRAVAYPSDLDDNLPYYVDSTNYVVELDTGIFKYLTVAQQYGLGLFFDWRAVGQYDTTLQDSIPTAISVLADTFIQNINIYVDFDSLPGQPF